MKTVILVTGASRGLGKVIYEHLAAMNDYQVYGTSRTPGDSGLLALDIRSEESVATCLSSLMDMEGQIDVLINNVGANLIGSLEGTSMEEFIEQVDLNCFGAVRMIKAVLPYFRSSKHGRIINISSIGAKVPLPFNSSYGAAKAALEAMSESLAYELDKTCIYVSVIEPIGLRITSEKPKLTYVTKETEIHKRSRQMYDLMRSKVVPSVTKEQVAKKVHMVLRSPQPKLRYKVGSAGGVLVVFKALLPDRVFRQWMMRQFIKK